MLYINYFVVDSNHISNYYYYNKYYKIMYINNKKIFKMVLNTYLNQNNLLRSNFQLNAIYFSGIFF
jgi:hypothetical protein